MFDAIVLAGSTNPEPLRECTGEKHEAKIKFGNKPMVRYVVDALIKSGRIKKIIVAGPPDLSEYFPEDSVHVIPSGNDVLKNLANAINYVDLDGKVLISAGDIPLLTPDAIIDFIDVSNEKEVDLYYPIISMDIVNKTFPGIKRTSVPLKEGTFTGGNLFIINPEALDRCYQKVNLFVGNRKSPLALARLLGIRFIIKYLLKILSLGEIERKASEILGIHGKAVISHYAEVGVDVDKPSDYQVVKRMLENKI